MTKRIDITPNPRILRTLGEIPFEIWQCLAELSDNSLDSFRKHADAGQALVDGRIDILWSGENIPSPDREIIVQDNGPGMSAGQLQDAARAGFSSSSPINNLGLFGMGFNISTARLGEETTFVSATKEDAEWAGIRINFEELAKSQSFLAPVETFPKKSPDESGTRIIVKKLKNGVFNDIWKKTKSIRKRLEVIYAPIIGGKDISIYIQGNKIIPRTHCVWGETRYIIRRGVKIHAVQQIDRDLGEAWFDVSRNRYLSEGEAAEFNIMQSRGEKFPEMIVKRSRRLKGWIGIQRYADTADFGIDFIRNGRKILVADKRLFGFENPDTGSFITEYPIDLGSSMGGRIVGELHVDYLMPTYQKNSFDTTDIAWQLTVEAIRGAGPILPKKRKALEYDGENDSPLGLLVSGYRRTNKGTKHLFLPSDTAKEFRRKFELGDPEYIQDDRWYKAAQEADKEEKRSQLPVDDSGKKPSDDTDEYRPSTETVQEEEPSSSSSSTLPRTTTTDDLINHSERVEQLCGNYSYDGKSSLSVTARKTIEANIEERGIRMPFALFINGIEADFFYDESHPLLDEYPISPRQILLQALAEKFAARYHGVPSPRIFVGLVENHLTEERINSEALKERAQAILNNILERLPSLLEPRIQHAMKIVKEVTSEEEALGANLLDENPDLMKEYYAKGSAKAHEALAYIPPETLIRLIDKMPEEFLDDKIFRYPYQQIDVGIAEAEKRLRRASVDKILNYLRDIRSLLKGSGSTTKYELIRYSNTLSILEDRLT